MRFREIVAAAALIVFVSSGCATPANAVISEVVGGTILLNKMKESVGSLIDQARDAGDFTMWRALITMRDALDAFERTSGSLLDKAFKDLDKAQQDFFRKADADIDKLTIVKDTTLDDINGITAQWAQIIGTTLIGNGKPYVVSYSPRVVVPEGEDVIRLKILGPKFADADVRLVLSSSASIGGASPLAYEADFRLNRKELSFKDISSSFVDYSLDYKEDPDSWFNKERRKKSDLTLWLLPKRLAHYKITTRVTVSTRETDTKTVNLGQFKGRNSRIPRAVPVPDSALGWRIDLTRRNEIRLIQGGADKGRCEGIEDNSITENGLTMFARVDNRDQFMNTRDAWTDCSISLPVYRIPPPQEADGPGQEGDLGWTKDDSFPLPANLISIKIETAIFDKRAPIFTGAGADKYFEIRSEGGLIILKPRPPREL
ncbi:hypothetical protein [Bradyrhizobium sp. RT4b]|uniref:hypothetical protein n=1 Tax=Bradyrhizobium sp. RT4b TaxID=3156379 RepID=UPI003392C4E0